MLSDRNLVSELAVLSDDVYYRLDDPDRLPLPPGWTMIKDYGDDMDYAGRAYVKNIGTDHPILVNSFEGTVFSRIDDILSDIQLFLETLPKHVDQAWPFWSDSYNHRFSKLLGDDLDLRRNAIVINTGHSLGAAVADFITAETYCNFRENRSIIPVSITFENPGVQPILTNWLKKLGFGPMLGDILFHLKNQCATYLAGVNLINTCNEQAVKTFRIKDMPYNYNCWDEGPYFPIAASYKLNPYYVVGNTLDQHSIRSIANKLQYGNFGAEEIQNPIGLNAGYVDYLDGSNTRYWDGYFREIWKKYPDLRKEYKNNIDKYLDYCFAQLKRTQQEARSGFFVTPDKMFNNQSAFFKPKTEGIESIFDDFVIIEKDNSEINPENKPQSSNCFIM